MAHALIVGISEMGKSHLARQLAESYLKRDYGVLVLDPNLDAWPCSYLTDDPVRFLAVAKRSRRCALFVDEGGETIGQGKQARDMVWLTTRSRHWGHFVFLMAHAATLIYKPIRRQCSTAYVFRQAEDDCRELMSQFADRALLTAQTLPARQFLYCRSGQPVQHLTLRA